MSLILRVHDAAGNRVGELPHFISANPQQEHNQVGMLTIDYPRNGRNAHLLDLNDALIALVEDGVVRNDWYILEDDADDPAAGGEGRTIAVGARGALALLERALVWTYTGSYGTMINRPMLNMTPGDIMRVLLQDAVARGVALGGVTWSFTATHDSAGQPWPNTYSPTYESTLNLLTIVTAMADNGWCDVRMVGRDLRLYVPETVCAVDRPDVILRVGKEVKSGPRKRSRRDVKSHMLGVGAESVNVVVSDAASAAQYGRRETYFSQGNTTNETTLTASTEAQLNLVKKVAEGFTVVFEPNPGDGIDPIIPYVDFGLGDYVRYDQRRLSPTELEPLRVRSVAQVYRQGRLVETSAELNDLFTEASIRLKRKVDGIVNGTTGVVGGVPPAPVVSPLAPERPTGLHVIGFEHFGAERERQASATLAWTAPTTNTDGSPLNDLRGYELFYSGAPMLAEPWWQQVTPESADEVATVGPLVTGRTYQFKVRAIDSSNTRSLFSDPISWTVPAPAQAPPVPSKPIVTTRLGTVTVSWDGKDADGAVMPAWFSHVEVHVANADGVAPSDGSLVDRLYGPGGTVIADLPYGTTRWVRFRSVSGDTPPAKSAGGATTSMQVQALVDTDIIGKVLDGAKFVDSTVPTSALADGAVSAQKLATDAIALITAAQDAANAAQGTANTALTSATGKNKIVWSTSAASGTTGYVAGDTWFRIDGSGVVIGQWEFTTSWQPRTIGNLVIAAVDAGKITTGTLDADRIAANSLQIGQVAGLQAGLAAKTTTFAQDSTPTALAVGDLWVKTNANNAMYRAAAVGANSIGAGAWVLVEPTIVTTKTFAQGTIPTSVTIGDLWVNTDDNNKMYRAAAVGATTIGAGAWVLVEPTVVTTRTFAQSAVPVAVNVGDLWVKTDANNTLYRAASVGADQIAAGEWVLVAQPTSLTFAQTNPPTSVNVGDLWVDTDDANKMYRSAVAGSATIGAGGWVALPPATVRTFAQNAAPTSVNVGDLWVDTDDGNKMYRSAVAGSSTIGAGGWVLVEPATTKTFAQPSIPTSVTAGDIWVDTDDDNKTYRAAAAGATTIGAGAWVLVERTVTRTFAQTSAPTSTNVGDIWVDTDDDNKTYRSAVAGSSTIGAGGWVQIERTVARTFAQGTIPTATNAGDIWVNTTNQNKTYRAAAAGANTIAAGGWVLVDNTEFAAATTLVNGWVVTGKTTIDGGKIETDSVTALAIAASAIGTDELAANSIIAGHIKAGEVTGEKIAALAIDAGKLAANAVTADKIIAGAVTAEKVAFGVLRTNLVPDSSFEETYDFTPWDPFGQWAGQGWTYGNTDQWRRGQAAFGGLVSRAGSSRSRSGEQALSLYTPGTPAGASAEASAVSPSVFITNGKTYKIVYYVAAVGGPAILSMHVLSNPNGPGISGFEGSQTAVGDASWAEAVPVVVEPVTQWTRLAWEFTANTTGWLQLRIMNFRPPGPSTLLVDDVSIVETGVGGAMELTAAGLRIFGNDGLEEIALVSNRPGVLTISKSGDTVAQIGDDGSISGAALSVADPAAVELGGFPLMGGLNDYTPAVTSGALIQGHLDKLPRGLVAIGHLAATGQVFNVETTILRLKFQAEPGRSYRVTLPPVLCYIGQVNRPTGFYIRTQTPVSPGSDTLGSAQTRMFSYTTTSATGNLVTIPGITFVMRCNQGGTGAGGELNAGTNEILLASNANATTPITMYSMSTALYTLTVEDIGLDFPSEGAYVYGGGSAVPKQTYTTTWHANGSRVFNQNNTVATGSGGSTFYDLVHGPVPGSSNNRYSIVTFGGNSVSSTSANEVGKTIASALTGATLLQVETYLYATHWYYNNGGTAYIRAYNSTTLPTTGAVSGTAKPFASWAKGAGKWVDITSVSSTSIRGILVGATGSSSLTTYGRFAGATQTNKPQLRMRYTK